MTSPRMYVASLTDHRAGRNIGEWFALDQYRNSDELHRAIGDWLGDLGPAAEGPRTEWAIHDYQNVPTDLRAQLRRHSLDDYLLSLQAPTPMAHQPALLERYSLPVYRVQLIREGPITYHAHSPEAAAPLLRELCCERYGDREVLATLYLGAGNQLLGAELTAIGASSTCLTDPPSVLRGAILAAARGIIIGHNHPSGSPRPSEADYHMTRVLAKAATTVDIPLLDHIVVTHDDAWSMADEGIL